MFCGVRRGRAVLSQPQVCVPLEVGTLQTEETHAHGIIGEMTDAQKPYINAVKRIMRSRNRPSGRGGQRKETKN